MLVQRMVEASVVVVLAICSFTQARMHECYGSDNTPQRCQPGFVNAAFGRTVIASNTCGSPKEEYCLQTGVTGVTKSCHICDNDDPDKHHDASLLTDLNNDGESTWWQTSSMLHDVQYPTMVNLTLNLTKSFDITYVRLKYHTSRPESFSIYKKSCDDCDWQPFQYYSGSCFNTYGLDNKGIVTVDNEQKALCTDTFSNISPLTGGNVAFSTLEGRPSAYNFDRSAVLQDWVKAVAIRVTLNRINTFGDEVFRDPKVLKSYYYAISDLSVGGREIVRQDVICSSCASHILSGDDVSVITWEAFTSHCSTQCSCNGHASECYIDANSMLTCRCKHNTAGRDCERCASLFNDRPWSRATRDNAGECLECDCNGMSDSCYFDAELYRQTGRGGHCTECRDNTAGPRCETCKPYHYRNPTTNRCTACECSSIGSYDSQCGSDGQCRCKPGVGGARCDQCLSGYFGLSEAGCSLCQCSTAGSVAGSVCDVDSGKCICKLNVEGNNCDRCKPETMNMQESNPYGCTACFCYGHSSVCNVAPDYTVAYIASDFQSDADGWEGITYLGHSATVRHTDDISMAPDNYHMSYFIAPGKYLGPQRHSYNQMLQFELWVEDQNDASSFEAGSGSEFLASTVAALASREDIVLEGDGFRVVASITDQGNPLPNTNRQLYQFRLHEAAGFQPRLSSLDFQFMLNSLEQLKIRSTYGEGLIGHLDNVQLTTAEFQGNGPPADWVEQCAETVGYLGDNSELCAPGFTRDVPNGGPSVPCVPCNCNGHADTCDQDTGVCDCQHNTMGDHCELCDDGFYFNDEESRRGTPQECQPCPCPENSACALMDDGSVVCTNCPPGHAGKQCEMCVDGWFGDPRGLGPCQRCMCNGNIDENAVMNCNRTTGECLKCIHNTTGFYCQECLPGYYGKPVTNDAEKRCRVCNCNHMGSRHISSCDTGTGQCDCLPNVEGRSCDRCRAGFWNIHSGAGCEACNCHTVGSRSSSTGACHQETGKCDCLPGVGGQRCDKCLPNHYNLTGDGCTACECNPEGSLYLQCGEDGQCRCKDGVHGKNCDQCEENYYDLASGCIQCPTCYGLVQDAVSKHRVELVRLETMMDSIDTQPLPDAGNDDFYGQLKILSDTVRNLSNQTQKRKEMQEVLGEKISEVSAQLEDLWAKLVGVKHSLDSCDSSVQDARAIIDGSMNDTVDIRNSLRVAGDKLNQAMADLAAAQLIADESANKNNNMSRLAQQAEQLANKHEAEANDVTTAAQAAYDTSRRAKDSVQESIDVLEDLLNRLTEMVESDNKIPAAEALRDELLAQSPGVKSNAEASKNQSTDLFTEASKLMVPNVDTDDMDSRSQTIQDEAQRLIPQISRLESEYLQNHANLETNIGLAREQLDLADAAQDTADKLLAQVDNSYHVGKDAVKNGNASYQAVLNTQKSLESFDKEISINRDRAVEALRNVDSIQEKIDMANKMTTNAQNALGTARTIAVQASDKAQQALNIAENIQSNAQNILTDAQNSHNNASEINASIEKLSSEMDATETGLEAAEERANKDHADVAMVTESASKAQTKVRDSQRRVTNVLSQLEDLLARLNTMSDVSDSDIALMEKQLEEYKAQVEATSIPETLVTLDAAVQRQADTLSAYDEQIAQLEANVANLREIRDAIPVQCATTREVEIGSDTENQ